MKLKQVVRYGMDFSGKWLSGSAFFAGLSFFLCVLYYYGFGKIDAVSGAAMVFGVVVPLVVLGAYALLLSGIRLNIPQVYACLAALYCLGLIIGGFGQHAVWQDVVGAIWYILCVAVLIVSTLGYFPGKWYASAGFFAAAVVRFFLRDFMGYFEPVELVAAIPEAASLSGILAFACLSAGLKNKRR